MRYSQMVVVNALLLLMAGQSIFAQDKPKWADGYFKEANNSYVEVVVGFGYDLDDAKNKAMQQIVERRSLATGTDAVVTVQGGNLQITREKKLVVSARIVDEYYEHIAAGQYKYYLLVQTAKNPSYTVEPVTVSEKYPFSARVFVPGMEQIYKGSVTKGVCFITGEVVFIGGVVVAECLRVDYENKIAMTHNASLKQQYLDYANTCEIVRNVSIAGMAAVYVWNIIDGIVAKGKRHVFLGDMAMRFSPYVDMNSVGLAFNMNF